MVPRLRRFLLESLGDPHFDDGLSRDAETRGFLIDGLNHPDREVHADTALFLRRATRGREIQARGNVVAVVEPLVEILSFHTAPYA